MPVLKRLITSIIICAAFFVSTSNTMANDANEILLSITHKGTNSVELDYHALVDLPSLTFKTTTIWTDGIQTFEGVPLKTLLIKAGITEGVVLATAVNDYAVEIPLSDISDTAPIVAYKNNEERMSLRDKGPLWIVYPYDSASEFQSEVVYSRSIWQLDRIATK